MCCNYWPVLQITDVPLVETRMALLNIPSPCLSWLSTMNSYARPGLRFDTVFWFVPWFVIFMVRHSGVSVARYLKPERPSEDSDRKLHRKVMLYHYRPVTGPSGSGFLDSRHMKVVRLSAVSTGRLYPREISLVPIHVKGWVDPNAIVRPEGLSQWKIPMTSSGFERVTFRLVAQRLNRLRHREEFT
jgi:hypothetical protein